MDKTSNDLLFLTDVATRLRCCEKTVLRGISEGKIPAYKSGRRLVFKKEDIDFIVKDREKLVPVQPKPQEA